MQSSYAWIIDKDHLSKGPNDPMGNEKGVVGPRDAKVSDDAVSYSLKCAELARNYENRARFKMYDDDRELYYSGTLYFDGVAGEEASYSPLADFGSPNAGCVAVLYPGNPGMDCG